MSAARLMSSRSARALALGAVALLVTLVVTLVAPLDTARAQQAPATPANLPSGDNDPLAPKVVSYGELANLYEYYPVKAKQMKIEGFVQLGVSLDAEGNVMNAWVVSETPANLEWGFGEAASRVALTVKFSNPRHVPTHAKLNVKFALSQARRES